MPSLVSGYTYDIFISYRQKDNLTPEKGDAGWVSNFVTGLKREIQSVIKEDVSIYFDENPFDGILETDDVHDSLKDKLRCLIFIPIVSQTYCDQESFAWKHEFIPFKTLSTEDKFGLKVMLHNGNVASRILPVCIHELDTSDREVIEKEMGPLRSVDFIFRSPGVNRPLADTDKREDSTTKIIYKDQVNKVANAVKELVKAMKEPPTGGERLVSKNLDSAKPNKNYVRRGHIFTGVLVFSIVTALLVMYFLRGDDAGAVIDKSIAVLPFVDMSAEKDLEFLGDGISEEIITSLTSIRDLRIVGRTSSFQFKGEKLDLREIGKKLNVSTVLEGSVQRSGDQLRITAQLIRTKDNSHVWSERYDVEQTDIFKIQDNIAQHIVEKLNLTLSSQEQNRLIKKETSEEAYTLYLKGLFQYKRENFSGALDLLLKVVALDSQYAPAYAYTALSKAWLIIKAKDNNITKILDAVHFAERAMALDPLLPEGYSGRALIAWAIEHDFAKARTYFEKSLELDPGSSLIKNRYAYFLTWMGDLDKASRLGREAMRIDPVDYNSYAILYLTNLYLGKLKEAQTAHQEWRRVFGTNQWAISREIELKLYKGAYEGVTHLCDSLKEKGFELAAPDLAYYSMASFALRHKPKSDQSLRQLIQLQKANDSEACYFAARVYAFMHQPDSCFLYLSKSIERDETGLHHLKVDLAFKDLHQDPRYIKLYNEYGFDKY